ncbi:MAG: hydrolase [Planctomycetes bacterium]|nr:hydrolase [Planctomycetota bacterium]
MLDTQTSCLVVIDLQGKLANLMQERESLFKATATLVQSAQQLNVPILWCQQCPDALGPTIEPLRALLAGETPINKSSFSCWANEHFRQRLAQINRQQVVLCGIETHICVWQTAMNLLGQQFEVEVVADAVSSRTAANKRLGLDRMRRAGMGITSLEMVLFEWLKDADHPNFDQIAKLIK